MKTAASYDGTEAPGAPAASHHKNQFRAPSRGLTLLSLLLRLATLVLSIVVIAVMVNAKQTRQIAILTFKARWNDSKAFMSLVILGAILIAYSLLQSVLALLHLCSSPRLQNKGWAWTVFILDQLLTYALLGAAAASAEVAYLAKHGSRTAGWNPVCSNFNTFCVRAGAAIILAFIAVLTLALSTAISAYHLFRTSTS